MISTSPQTIPVNVARCPIHKQLVGFDGEGNLVGRCSGCAREAAQGIVDIEQGVAKANQWAREELQRLGIRR